MNKENKEILASVLKISIDDIKPGMCFEGNANLENSGISELPERFSTTGFLDLSGCPIEYPPADMKIGGFFSLEGSAAKVFPKRLKTGGYVNIHNTDISEVDDELFCGGDFDPGNAPIRFISSSAVIEGKIHMPHQQKAD